MKLMGTGTLFGFLIACAAGILIAVLYDVFRILRTLRYCEKKQVFFQDLIFMASFAVVTFLVALATSAGYLRFYVLAGEGIGISIYFLTFGEITIRFVRGMLRVFTACKRLWIRYIAIPLRKKYSMRKEMYIKRSKIGKKGLKNFIWRRKTLENPKKNGV